MSEVPLLPRELSSALQEIRGSKEGRVDRRPARDSASLSRRVPDGSKV